CLKAHYPLASAQRNNVQNKQKTTPQCVTLRKESVHAGESYYAVTEMPTAFQGRQQKTKKP
ncbi:hypothetical protein, partial [Comamonas jiangduensis]|uniref:hypothetical protein n=1 Tax=Comamonas jiangduensis TaxID=1194168 RepID=UPI0024E1031F